MGSIFQDSDLTIVISHVLDGDGDGGCFLYTPERVRLSFEETDGDYLGQLSGVFRRTRLLHREIDIRPHISGVDRMQLSHRAWVLQERKVCFPSV